MKGGGESKESEDYILSYMSWIVHLFTSKPLKLNDIHNCGIIDDYA